jgi:glycosyltransferase involved in cell wall biosynthesis
VIRPGGVGDGNARVLAIVPAFNEGRSLGNVVTELFALDNPPDVLVVDDGSTDDTVEVAMGLGARVLSLPYNCGIGATVQAGLAWGLERGYGVIARFDGDGQHDPRALHALRRVIDIGEADFVVGSRYVRKEGFQSTFLRRAGSKWFALLLRVLSGLKITDPTSGCWVANARAAAILRSEYSYDYPEVDSLIRLHRAGCTIKEESIEMRARAEGRSSIDAVRAVYYMFKVTIALVIGRIEHRAGETK